MVVGSDFAASVLASTVCSPLVICCLLTLLVSEDFPDHLLPDFGSVTFVSLAIIVAILVALLLQLLLVLKRPFSLQLLPSSRLLLS